MKKSLYGKYEAAKLYARELRKHQTPGEKAVWRIIRNKNIAGKRFLRQYVFEYIKKGNSHFFIVDFYCPEASLVLEVDGGVHEKQKEYDKLREEILVTKGFKIIRLSNEDVKDKPKVIALLDDFFNNPEPSSLRAEKGGRGVVQLI